MSPRTFTRGGALAFALALAAATPARADGPLPRYTLSLSAQSYRPGIDDEFASGTTGPYRQIFGSSRGWMFHLDLARTVLSGRVGAIDVGVGAGYFQASGKGLYQDDSGAWVKSADATALHLLPLSAFVSARFELLKACHVPLVPYARLALVRDVWWVGSDGGGTTRGATDGWAATAGLGLHLNALDPSMAREMNRDAAIRDTYLTVDVTRSVVDDFGSSRSWTVSDPGWALGIGLLSTF